MKVTAEITFFLIYFLSINFLYIECVLIRRKNFIRDPICINLAGEFECEYAKNSLNMFSLGHFNFLHNYFDNVENIPVSNKLLDFNNFLWNKIVRFEKNEKESNFLKFSIIKQTEKNFPLIYNNKNYHLQSFSITKNYNTISNINSDLEFLFFLAQNEGKNVSGQLLRLSVFFKIDDDSSKYVSDTLFENILSVLNFNEKNKTTEKVHKEFEVFNSSGFLSYLNKNSNFLIQEFQIDKIAEALVCNKQLTSVVIQDIFPISKIHLEKITKFLNLINIGNNTHVGEYSKISHFSFSNKALELKKFVKIVLNFKNKANTLITNLNILKKPLPNYLREFEDEIELKFDFPLTSMVNRIIKHPSIIQKVSISANKSNRTLNITRNSQIKLSNDTRSANYTKITNESKISNSAEESVNELLNQNSMINMVQEERKSSNSTSKDDEDENLNISQIPQIQKLIKLEEEKNSTINKDNKLMNSSISPNNSSNTTQTTNIISKNKEENQKSSTFKSESQESYTILKNIQPIKNIDFSRHKNNSKGFIPRIYKNEKLSITPEGGLDYEETLIIGDEDPQTFVIKK